jgi:hypothetical protein
MLRIILGVVAGLAAWGSLLAIGGLIVRTTWEEYAAVADAMTFTLPMLVMRLAMGAATLLIAGWIAARIARRTIAPLFLGIALLTVFIPIHISLWDRFPVWYHLTFLLTLIPLATAGGRIGAQIKHSRPAST